MQRLSVFIWVGAVLSMASCSHTGSKAKFPDSKGDKDHCRQLLANCKDNIRQIEFVLVYEGPGTKTARVGPVVVTDKDLIASFQEALEPIRKVIFL